MTSRSKKKRPENERCHAPGPVPRRRLTLEVIVQRYIDEYGRNAQRELRFYAKQQRLKRAIELAALARLPSGKRHPHQHRIPPELLERAREYLLHTDFSACGSFSDLHHLVDEAIGSIRGIGELTVYDTAQRIGAHLGLEPDAVYLHAGTWAGARALGIDGRRKVVEVTELPRALARLTPREIEDCLCIFKDELADFAAA